MGRGIRNLRGAVLLQFAAQQKANVRPSSDLAKEQNLFKGIGPA